MTNYLLSDGGIAAFSRQARQSQNGQDVSPIARRFIGWSGLGRNGCCICGDCSGT